MNLKGKRVLVRIDANVPIKKGKAVDGPNGRIAKAAVGINWLSQRGAKVIIMSHLGRPNGRRTASYSLKPVAKRLSNLIGVKIKLSKSITGSDVENIVEKMNEGEIILLENIRFDLREKQNSSDFTKELSVLADMYVNDAFSVSHREHASVSGITKEIPAYAGPLLSNEVSVLSKLNKNTKEPFVVIMGGLKVQTKMPVIKNFEKQASNVLIGGALANTFFAAEGLEIGRSVFDELGIDEAKNAISHLGKKLILPIDVVVVRSLRKDAKLEVKAPDSLNKTDRIVDIGPKTRVLYKSIIEHAKVIVYNGPMGYCEINTFCAGTKFIAKAIANKTSSAVTIVGGGDTVPVLERLKIADKFTLLSTGGSAMLKFLAGKKLPGLEVLKIKN